MKGILTVFGYIYILDNYVAEGLDFTDVMRTATNGSLSP